MFVTDYQGILYYEEFVEGDRTTKEALCDFLGHDELTENQVLEYVKTSNNWFALNFCKSFYG
jgi:hypothetical protein